MQTQRFTPLEKLIVLAMKQTPDVAYTYSGLSEITGSSPFTMTRLVRKMIKRGLLTRGKDGQTSLFRLVDPSAPVLNDVTRRAPVR